jgi:hypothetical protein
VKAFFSYFLEKERKDFKAPQISFLMLKSNKTKLKTTQNHYQSNLHQSMGFVISSLNFKHIVMTNFNALISN